MVKIDYIKKSTGNCAFYLLAKKEDHIISDIDNWRARRFV